MKRYLVIPDEYKIVEIDVVKENALSYWVFKHPKIKDLQYIRPKRFNRNGLLFETWEQAHVELLGMTQKQVENRKKSLELVKSYYGNVKGMKNPYLGAVNHVVEGTNDANQ